MNVVGAILFFLYIALALIWTISILLTLRSQARASHKLSHDHSVLYRPRIRTLSVLALFSFTLLTYTMMSILLESYSDWTFLFAADISLRPKPHGLIAITRDGSDRIWLWSTSANFFSAFATGILRTDATRIWARMALVNSVAWSIWASDVGHQDELPNLNKYFYLVQLLPTSFSQLLFFVALDFQRRKLGANVERPRPSETVPTHLAYTIWGLLFAVIMESAGEITPLKAVVPRILLIRSMLVAPVFIPTIMRNLFGRAGPKCFSISADGFPLALVWLAIQAGDIRSLGFKELFKGLQEGHPAIRALGYDLIISWVGVAVYLALRPPSKTMLQHLD